MFAITAHTTTGILVNESLACLEVDIEKKLEELVPTFASYNHNHFLPSYGAIGCNAPGHLKSMICGNHAVFPIVDGHVVCGNAQDVYFGEFDGHSAPVRFTSPLWANSILQIKITKGDNTNGN